MPTKKKYTYKQKTSKKKQYNKKKRTIKKRHTRKKTRYGGNIFGSLWSSRPNLPKVRRPQPPPTVTVSYHSRDLPLYKVNRLKLLETLRTRPNEFKEELDRIDEKGYTKKGKNGVTVTPAGPDAGHPSKHEDFMLNATRINPKAWKHADETLRKDRDLTLKAIDTNAYVLEHIDEKFKDDKEVVTAAVKKNGIAIKFASVDLLQNDDFLVELLKLYWGGEIKYPDPPRGGFSLGDNNHPIYPYPPRGGFSLGDNNHPIYDENFNLFFLYIIYIKDNEGKYVLEDEGERMNKLIKRAHEEINEEAGRNVFEHNHKNRSNRNKNINHNNHDNGTN